MAIYKYQCIDSDGQPRDGVLQADSPAEAHAELEKKCWRVLTLFVAGGAKDAKDTSAKSPSKAEVQASGVADRETGAFPATARMRNHENAISAQTAAGAVVPEVSNAPPAGQVVRAAHILKSAASRTTGFARSVTASTIRKWRSTGGSDQRQIEREAGEDPDPVPDELAEEILSTARAGMKPRKRSAGVSAKDVAALKRSVARLMPWQRHVSYVSIALLMRQCSMMLRSGVSIGGGLKSIARGERNPILRLALLEIVTDITSGKTVSAALSRQKALHTPALQGLIEAGEQTGEVYKSFDRYAANLERTAGLVRSVRSAMTYPTVVIGGAAIMVCAFFRFIFPQFVGLLSELQAELPWPTKLLFAIHNFLSNPFLVLGVLLIAAFLAWLVYENVQTTSGRLLLDRWLLNVPLAGQVVERVAVCNFLSTLSSLMSSGCPVILAMKYASATCGNGVVSEQIEGSKQRVEAGLSLSDAFAASPMFTGEICAMLNAGEQSGNLVMMIEKLCVMMNEDVQMKMEAATRVIEPLMMAGLGLVVGFLFLALFLPIYQVIGTLGG